jgi:hypothetical protein
MGRDRPDDCGFHKPPEIVIGPVVNILGGADELPRIPTSRLAARGGNHLQDRESEQKNSPP